MPGPSWSLPWESTRIAEELHRIEEELIEAAEEVPVDCDKRILLAVAAALNGSEDRLASMILRGKLGELVKEIRNREPCRKLARWLYGFNFGVSDLEFYKALKECPLTRGVKLSGIEEDTEEYRIYEKVLKGRKRSIYLIEPGSPSSSIKWTHVVAAALAGLEPRDFKLSYIDNVYGAMRIVDSLPPEPHPGVDSLLLDAMSAKLPTNIKFKIMMQTQKYFKLFEETQNAALSELDNLYLDESSFNSLVFIIMLLRIVIELIKYVDEIEETTKGNISLIRAYELAWLHALLLSYIPDDFYYFENPREKFSLLKDSMFEQATILAEKAVDYIDKAFYYTVNEGEDIKEIIEKKISNPFIKKLLKGTLDARSSVNEDRDILFNLMVYELLTRLIGNNYGTDRKALASFLECVFCWFEHINDYIMAYDSSKVTKRYIFPNKVLIKHYEYVIEAELLSNANKVRVHFASNGIKWAAERAAEAFVRWGKECNARIVKKGEDWFVGEVEYRDANDKECICYGFRAAALAIDLDLYRCDVFDEDSLKEAVKLKKYCAEIYFREHYDEDEEEEE